MVDVIIVAAGKSDRFGEDKLMYKIGEFSIIEMSLNIFLKHDLINNVILVTSEEVKHFLKGKYKQKILYTTGGKTRSESVLQGLGLITSKKVLVHDGARPYVTKKLVTELIKNLEHAQAVIPVEKITNCLKLIRNGTIKTVNRDEYFTTQTPQAFRTCVLREAFNNFDPLWFDEAQAVETLGIEVMTILGEKTNVKITFKEDVVKKPD